MAIKQSRGITIGKGTPQRLEGQNGDMSIRSSRKGLKLYVKESNKWHSVDLDIDLRGIASTVRKLEDEVKKLSTKTNNTPVVDKLLLRQSGGTAAVGIQNKSGNIAFRNSTDSSDAKLQSVALDIGTNNSSGRGWGQFYYNSETNTKSHYIESKGLVLAGNLNNPDDVSHSKIFLINNKSDSAIVMYRGIQSRYIMGFDNVKSTTFTDSTCDTSSGDATVTMDDVSALIVGSTVSGTGIPANATIDSITPSANTFELSADATADGTNVTLTFQTADGRFKIHNGHTFADDSIFNLDTNGVNLQGAISYKHGTHSTAGPTDNVDVAGISVLRVNTVSNNVTIGGFVNGVEGQILHIVKTSTNNFIQLEHNESTGNQDILLTSGSDERVVGYGGYTLYCNGTNWYSLSNPTGAADAG
tara:strand:+ start:1159 stop:2403 length:1245 start_codon:yes stop_codon:yes gene_type:complete